MIKDSWISQVGTVTLLTYSAGLSFFNVSQKRVTHRTNSLHAGAQSTVWGEGQRLNGSRPTKNSNPLKAD